MCPSCKSSLNVCSPRPTLIFGESDHEALLWIMSLLQPTPRSARPPHPPTHRSLPYTAFFLYFFFPLHHEESECLIIPDNHFCLSCQYSVRFMCPCGSAPHVLPERHADWTSAPRPPPLPPHPPCGGLSCSAASGSERRDNYSLSKRWLLSWPG